MSGSRAPVVLALGAVGLYLLAKRTAAPSSPAPSSPAPAVPATSPLPEPVPTGSPFEGHPVGAIVQFLASHQP